MGLSAPLALLGLALVGVPIVAHLLRRADVRTRTLPTVELLRRAAVESRRRVRVVDPWLLLVRVALVALAALALAGPFSRVELTYGDGRVASVAIVIDDSMSMHVADAEGTRFDEALRRARGIVDALPAGSEVALVLGGVHPRVAASRTSDLAALRVVLGSLASPEGAARGSDLLAAAELAARQLAGARHALRRLVVLSDFAGPADGAALEVPAGMVLDAERVGDETPRANVALTHVALDAGATGGLRLSVEARAFGDDAPAAVPLVVRWRGRELARTELSIERGAGRVVVELETPGTSEELDAEPYALVSIATGDVLPTDDTRAVLLRAPTAPRVLVVDGRPSSLRRRAPGEDDGARFVRDALALVPRSGGGAFVTRVVDAAGLLSVPVGAVDVLVLAGLDTSAEAVADAVRAHVGGGAGLLVTAGPDLAPGSEGRLADLLPARTTAIVDGATEGLERVEGTGVLPPGATGLEHVHVTRRMGLEAGEPADVVLRFAGGAPALVVSNDARAGVLALPLDASASDLPYRPGYLPLLSRVLRALARPGAMPDEPMPPGEVPALATPGMRGAIELTLPNGSLLSREIEGGRVLLDDLEVAGAYLARLPGSGGTLVPSPRSAFVIAPPLEESDLSVGVLPPRAEGEGPDAVARAVVERPLGRWAFLAVGAFAVVEGLARARRTGARGAPAPSGAPARTSRAG